MEFKTPYLLAMRDQAPQMFAELQRSNQLDHHLQEKSLEAHSLLKLVLGNDHHPSLAKERQAEEIVRATLIEFSKEGKEPSLEPPEDLPGHPGA